jgi:hypothetical protein
LTNTCMVSYRTTQLGVLLCGGKVKEDTYACLLTRCNEFLKFAAENAHLITVVTMHEKVKRLIMTDPTISTDMRIYNHLLSTSVDTLSMVKKADSLVIMHQANLQTAEANLKSAQDLLSPKKWKTQISHWDVIPSSAASLAREEEDSGRSRDRTPSQKTKSVAFAPVRPSSPTSQVTAAAATAPNPSPQEDRVCHFWCLPKANGKRLVPAGRPQLSRVPSTGYDEVLLVHARANGTDEIVLEECN